MNSSFTKKPLRVGVIGAGFWPPFQLEGWREAGSVQCVAICDLDRAKAEALATRYGIPAVYTDATEMLERERLDFIDIITSVETHPKLVALAVKYRIPVICQKPMAPTLEQAAEMVRSAQAAGVPFFIHENWRWQTPIREVKRLLDEGRLGKVFRARVDMISGFPVFTNQPFLKTLEQFIITDMGSHTLDTARFLFGEMQTLYCLTQRVHQDIAGEDVATIILHSQSDVDVIVEMAYAGTPLEDECFPQTCMFIEGDKGSLELDVNYKIRVTTKQGTETVSCPPPNYAWVDPNYAVVQASVVPCNTNLRDAIAGVGQAETTGADNYETVRLVFASYLAARENRMVDVGPNGFGHL